MGKIEEVLAAQGFITPPAHEGFLAKRLYNGGGEIIDASIAYVLPGGGGPTESHTHTHDHLFMVVSGTVKIIEGENEVILHANESRLVRGTVPHSTVNIDNQTLVMIGISIKH